MDTRIDEIGDRVYRVSTYVPEIAPPAGFTFNQFLVDAEEPLLFHAGMRSLFPAASEAIGRVVPLERLRWVTFGHMGEEVPAEEGAFGDGPPVTEADLVEPALEAERLSAGRPA